MSRVGIAHHHSAITVGGAHPTATFSWTFVSPRLMRVHPKIPFVHPPPSPLPLREGTKGRGFSCPLFLLLFLLLLLTNSLLIAHRFFYSVFLGLFSARRILYVFSFFIISLNFFTSLSSSSNARFIALKASNPSFFDRSFFFGTERVSE